VTGHGGMGPSRIRETSDRSRIVRHAERSLGEEVSTVLADGYVAHVGFSVEGQPFVAPMTYHYDPADAHAIYIHGARPSRLNRLARQGVDLCLTVTVLEGLVYSKTASMHSMNYRSATCFGVGTEVTDLEEKRRIFHAMIRRYFPDRDLPTDFQAATEDELHSVSLIRVEIEEWSGKQRSGGPLGDGDADSNYPGTAGIIDLRPA
jgi:nitroimidazol reductase NimA-like FMN-containing flavoprotein (pyridoxamine 5'-phosphate oxidase superfamily)